MRYARDRNHTKNLPSRRRARSHAFARRGRLARAVGVSRAKPYSSDRDADDADAVRAMRRAWTLE
jgi:hypothetical protein